MISDPAIHFRDPQLVKALLEKIRQTVKKPHPLMLICGGQTHSMMHYGLQQLLPPEIELINGPGCPVCVTSLELIDKALAIARLPQVIFTSYGDMLRVPGSYQDLLSLKAQGHDIRIVYSPLDAVDIAEKNPDHEIVFFAIGFETTAPANLAALSQAQSKNIKNFSLLVSQVCVPPAMRTLLSAPQCRIQGFLAAGHVCAIMGTREYEPIAHEYTIPITVTGFEPVDLLNGIYLTVKALEENQPIVQNAYSRVVSSSGNTAAQQLINHYYKICDRHWRGIGLIPDSGWRLKSEFAAFDAEEKFSVSNIQSQENPVCIAGQILQGIKTPLDCPAFNNLCTPQKPLGATMVSSEGTCAAYYRYQIKS